MLYRVAPNKQSIAFVGDISVIRMNRFGVAWQEYLADDLGMVGFMKLDFLNSNQTADVVALAEAAGAKKSLTPKTRELRFSFSKMPENGVVNCSAIFEVVKNQ